MTATLVEEFDRLLRAYHSGSPLALVLDYDGTLTPIVDHPDQARLPARARWLLSCLASQPALVVAVLAGRSLENLQQLVPVAGVVRGGNAGLELQLKERTLLHPQALAGQALLAQAAGELQSMNSAFPRSWVEVKKLGLTLHFRQVAPELRPQLVDRAQALLGRYADRLQVVEELLALEVSAVPGWNKGSAVELLLEQMPAETFPFYAGDSASDREAFLITAGRGGVTVGVGPEALAEAQYTVPTPDALIDVLARLLPAITVAGLK